MCVRRINNIHAPHTHSNNIFYKCVCAILIILMRHINNINAPHTYLSIYLINMCAAH